jgi:hypothetical protein
MNIFRSRTLTHAESGNGSWQSKEKPNRLSMQPNHSDGTIVTQESNTTPHTDLEGSDLSASSFASNGRVRFGDQIEICFIAHLSRDDYSRDELDACFWVQDDVKTARMESDVLITKIYSHSTEWEHPLHRAYIESQKLAWVASRSKIDMDQFNAKLDPCALGATRAINQWTQHSELRGLESLARNHASMQSLGESNICKHVVQVHRTRVVEASKRKLSVASIAFLSQRLSMPNMILARLMGIADTCEF